MDRAVYGKLRQKACEAARRQGDPSFYRAFQQELALSRSSLMTDASISRCKGLIDETRLHPAHGMDHGEQVALEAGALIQVECLMQGGDESLARRMLLCAQIAGLLHDIRRNEKDHTVHGSREAERLLEGFALQNADKRYIIAAIRNHEAFREVLASEDAYAQMVSDCLYDADKFRWGPDNFTKTLWLMMETTATPAGRLYEMFQEKMEGIRRIGDTFRTATGRRYGPEFINMGLAIGCEVYREMGDMLKG